MGAFALRAPGDRVPALLLALAAAFAFPSPAFPSPATGAVPDPAVPLLVVAADPGLEGDARRVEALDRERLWTAMRLAGLDDPGPPIRVRLIAESSPEAAAVRDWVAGFARGAGGPVVIFPARTPRYPSDSLEELLHHEVAHVLISRAARGGEVPRWFHEGVAMAAGSAWGLGDRSRFAVEVLRRGRVPLDRIDRLFAGGSGSVGRAYAVSGAFVRDLRRRHGPWITGDVLRRVGRGVAFDRAFHQATGESLAAAEERFWRRETFWQRWVPFLTSSFVLWLGVTLLAVLAFRRRRQRDAELELRWELEERRQAAARAAREVWRDADAARGLPDPSAGDPEAEDRGPGSRGSGDRWVH